jgi:prolipoprotein diacylglyceryltransferase
VFSKVGVGVVDIGGPFVLSIDPVFLDLGEIKLWYYGLAYAIGFSVFFVVYEKASDGGSAGQ